MTKTKLFVALALCAATTACDNRTPLQQTGYAFAITTAALERNRCLTCWPILADSVRVDGPCVNYWRDGAGGRVCGEFTVEPILQPRR